MVHVDIPQEDFRPEVMREALAGRVERVPPSIAIAMITQLDLPTADQHALLQSAIQDTKLQEQVRAAAVRAYARAAGDAAIPALLKALDASDERVAAAAASAIGQLGTPEQLTALRKNRRGGDLLKRRVAFAEVLIVHRFGVTNHDVALPAPPIQQPPSGVGDVPFVTVRPGVERRARAIEGIKREFPSLDAAKQDVYELQCGPRLMEIAVDRSAFEGAGNRLQQPALPAIVAFQDMEYGEFHPALLVLSHAEAKDRYKVVLTRMSGEQVYVGEGSGARGELDFELRSAKAPGIASIAARVRVNAKGVHVSGVSERRAVPGEGPAKEQG